MLCYAGSIGLVRPQADIETTFATVEKMKRPYPPYPAIEQALTEVIVEARSKGKPIHTETVTTSEEWDDTLGIWLFYESDAEAQAHRKDGTNEWIEKKFVEELDARKLSFGFSKLPTISFMFDSAENVKKNYQGSYYLRMR
jgi:hypothetical protein